MRSLLNFFLKNVVWFVFIFFEIICFYFIFGHNSYQRSVFFNSSNLLSGKIYSITGSFSSYFGLKEENKELLAQNATLKYELQDMKKYIQQIENDTLKTNAFFARIVSEKSNQHFVVASVVNNSISHFNNFITINKGRIDGISEDFGVVSQNGIVGVVRAVSDHYAVIQSVLNANTRFSCKIYKSNTPGILIWDGDSPEYATLTDYPRYEKIQKGDTIVTSGFSGIFPQGIKVGTLESYESEANDNFNNLKIKLFTKFSNLKNVFVIIDNNKEKEELERKVY